jgi:hypothetical protein
MGCELTPHAAHRGKPDRLDEETAQNEAKKEKEMEADGCKDYSRGKALGLEVRRAQCADKQTEPAASTN